MSDDQISPDQDDSQSSEAAELETSAAPKKERSGNSIAWLATLFSIIALAIVAYGEFQQWRSNDDAPLANLADDNRETIAAVQQSQEEFGQTLDRLQSQLQALPPDDDGADIEALRTDVEQQLRLLNSMPARMASLENSVASLAGISAGARQTFLLAEAEYYLQIANAQLQLANNPQLAALALGMADERVTKISDPALINVRRSIADERAALEVMEKPDLAGATLTLASLARVVESLPLVVDREAALAEQATDEAQSGAAKAWGSVKDAMSGLVKVTPPDQAKLQQLSPDAEYFLRNNMAMQLQAARLALLRGEQAVFEQALDDTSLLLDTYFDTQSEQVIGAQQTLGEIRNSVFTSSSPDISGSLRQLRQYQTLRESVE